MGVVFCFTCDTGRSIRYADMIFKKLGKGRKRPRFRFYVRDNFEHSLEFKLGACWNFVMREHDGKESKEGKHSIY